MVIEEHLRRQRREAISEDGVNIPVIVMYSDVLVL